MATVTETSELRRRRTPTRRFSTNQAGSYITRSLCQSLPHSLEALDLPTTSLSPSLASLRHHVLSYLAELEARLSQVESPVSSESLKTKGEMTVDEAHAWARDGLELLRSIRNDVYSHIPDITFDNVRTHMPDVPRFDDMRARMPDMPDVRSHLPDLDLSDMRSRLDDVRARVSDIDFHRPLDYVHTLSDRLQSLQTHLSSIEFPPRLDLSLLSPSGALSGMYDKVASSDFVAELSSDIREGERIAYDVARAMKQSLNGSRLIQYADLPKQWRNNPFVQHGYRFIPLSEWPRLLLSLFALHNETLNIHTHLIPFVAWLVALFPFTPLSSTASEPDPPMLAFTAFALLCLFTSALWHTMAGCAHPKGMELCARIDYVGIGWLISASVGTVVHYGFQCDSMTHHAFLALCLLMGISGSILPFMDWFNEYEYRNYRIAFFLALAFSSVAPLADLAYIHSASAMAAFIRPVVPSLFSYVAGLVFYATHFPECYLSSRWEHSHVLDRIGGGSHAIWHVFIVLAISQHRTAMAHLKGGIGEVCT